MRVEPMGGLMLLLKIGMTPPFFSYLLNLSQYDDLHLAMTARKRFPEYSKHLELRLPRLQSHES